MPFLALPTKLGASIDVCGGQALASVLPGHPPHVFNRVFLGAAAGRTPAALLNHCRLGVPLMAFLALPAKLGAGVNVSGGQALAPTGLGYPAHVCNRAFLGAEASRTPGSFCDAVGHSLPLMAFLALPTKLGARVDVSGGQALPTVLLREFMHVFNRQFLEAAGGAPASLCNIVGNALPLMALATLPGKLGAAVDVDCGQTFAVALFGYSLHVLNCAFLHGCEGDSWLYAVTEERAHLAARPSCSRLARLD